MNNYYVTFGQQSPAKNGWIRVVAADYMDARRIVFAAYGTKWSGLYEEKDFEPSYYPAGELGIIK